MNELEKMLVGIMTGIGYELAMELPQLLLKYEASGVDVIPIKDIKELLAKATMATMGDEDFNKALKDAINMKEPNSEN